MFLTPGPRHSVAAIVLAGGRASRLDGADKGQLAVAGRPMVQSVLGAAKQIAAPVVVVGPGGDTRENPPYSGPVAGIAAGMAGLADEVEVVVVVACDLPDLDAGTLSALVDTLRAAPAMSAALAVDPDGHDQFLLAAWDRRALAARLDTLERSGGVGGRPVRALYDDDAVTLRVPVGAAAADVDTWEDLAGRGPVALTHVRSVLRAGLPALPVEVRAPLNAVGSVLTTPLLAQDPMPRGPVSAMDGYAVAGPGPWRLTSIARRAGDDSPVALPPGTAATVATGALAPSGSDRVLRHELVDVRDGLVTASPGAEGVNDLRPVGEDWDPGQALAPADTIFDAALASAALSAGLTEIQVRGPVRAAVVTTGDEVLPADAASPLPPGRIRDTVGPLLGGVLRRAGFGHTGPPVHCPDTAEAVEALLTGSNAAVAQVEAGGVLVMVGATGRGIADHLRPALQRVGARVVLDGVRVRPGGSQLVALLPGGRVLLGLPGNPLAAISAAATTGRALIDAVTGRERTPVLARVCGLADLSAPLRARILPARPDGTGGWILTDRVRTAHLADLAGAPALAVVPEGATNDSPVELVDWI